MARQFKAPRTRKSNVWVITSGKEAGRWAWEIEIMRTDGSAYRRAGTRKTEKDAIDARDAAFASFNKDGGKAGRSYTVQSWCEYCLDGGLTNQSKKTLHHYRGWLESRVYPSVGRIKLDQLRVDVLQIFYQGLQEKDVPSAAVRVRTALNACLTRAVEEGVLDRHPGRIAKLKKTTVRTPGDEENESPGKQILTVEEQARLIEAAKGTTLYWPVILGLKFGLRIGECLGLKWSDFDFEARTVRIRRQVQQIIGEGKQFTGLKTNNSYRTLPIPSSLFCELSSSFLAAKAEEQELVCPNRAGRPFTPQEISIPFKKLAMRAEINGKQVLVDCTHHDLRSTFLTFLANYADGGRGVRPAVLRAIAGHGKIDTTYRYYIRTSETDLRDAMEFVD